MKTSVLKIGGSVLIDASRVPAGADLIQAHISEDRCVVAVISALQGETDRLLDAAAGFLDAGDYGPVAEKLVEGERQARDLIASELLRRGHSVGSIDPWEIGLEAEGSILNGHPVSVDLKQMAHVMNPGGVLLIPGFFGMSENGAPILFGRGGSDLTAVYLAGEWPESDCVLYKNVPGVAEGDPQGAAEDVQFRSHIDWEEMTSIGGRVVQPKALHHARSNRITFRITNSPTVEGTVIGGPSQLGSTFG